MVSIEAINNCLAAASAAPNMRMRALHIAVARNLVTKMTEEIAGVRLVLEAQEAELVRVADLKQLTLDDDAERP